MRTFSADAQAALEAGRFGKRVLFSVEMADGPVGFWDDAYDLTYAGVVHYGVCNALKLSAVQSGGDGVARNMQVSLSGLDATAAAQVEALSWHQRPVTVRQAILSHETNAIVHVETVFAGFLDQMPRRERVGGMSELVATIESIQRELGRKGARTRSDSDQRQIDSSDGFFKHVAVAAATEVYWGRLAPGATGDR